MIKLYLSDFDQLISDNFNQIVDIESYTIRKEQAQSTGTYIGHKPFINSDNIYMVFSNLKGVGILVSDYEKNTEYVFYDEYIDFYSILNSEIATLDISIPHFKIEEIKQIKQNYIRTCILQIINALSSGLKREGRHIPDSDCTEAIEILINYSREIVR